MMHLNILFGGASNRERMMTRRQFLWGMAATGVAVSIPAFRGLALELNRRTLGLWNDGQTPIRIGHLTDLHSSPFVSLRHIRQAIELVVGGKPDLICLTGDFVNDLAPDPDGLADALQLLTAHAPTFACLGNHDGGRWLAERGGPPTPDATVEVLHAAGIRVLRDETEAVRIRDRRILLTGLQDVWSADIRRDRAGFGSESDPRIVLAHNPDTKDVLTNEPWNLMLSGHTHGGQIRLPFFGGRLTAPVMDDRYIEGLLPWQHRHLHISRGVGALGGLRINCPPEANLIDLT